MGWCFIPDLQEKILNWLLEGRQQGRGWVGTFSKLVTWAFCLSGCFSQLRMTGCEFGMLKNKDLSSQKSALQKGCVWMEVPRLGWWPWLVMLSEFGNLDLRGRRFCSGTWVCLPAPPEWLACPWSKPSRSQARPGIVYRGQYIFPVLVIRGQFCAHSARGPQGVEMFYLLKSAAVILDLPSHSLPPHLLPVWWAVCLGNLYRSCLFIWQIHDSSGDSCMYLHILSHASDI